MSKSRLEAFSDGVIAIAITLLVLDLKVPAAGSGSLGHELAQQWPSYVAYLVSFLTIGIIWINHHAMIRNIKAVDHQLLFQNLLLLLFVGILPWSTALMAEYLRESQGEHLAAAIYAGSLLLMAVAFYGMQRHLMNPASGLLSDEIDDASRRAIDRRNRAGLIPYAIATAVAPLSAYLTLFICGALVVFYAIPAKVAGSDES
jgi:uncharacterized membrane protein